MLTDVLLQTELDLVGYLSLDPELVDVRVIPARTARGEDEGGNINDLIEQALAGIVSKNGKSGVIIIVLMPDAVPVDPNLPGPQMDLTCEIRIVENRLINEGATGTGLSAPQLAIHVSRVLDHWSPNSMTILRHDSRMIEELTATDQPAWAVRFRLRYATQALPKTPSPLITAEADQMVSLSCALPAAEIRYTLDGCFPGGESSMVYDGPFLFTEGELRVIALAPDYRPSNVSEADFSAP